MMICPKCNEMPMKPSDRFCFQDGAALVERASCECGRSLNLDLYTFCPACGKEIE